MVTHYPLLFSGVGVLGSLGAALWSYVQYSSYQQQIQELQDKLPQQPLDKMTSGKTPEENSILRDYTDLQSKLSTIKQRGKWIAMVAIISCIACIYFYRSSSLQTSDPERGKSTLWSDTVLDIAKQNNNESTLPRDDNIPAQNNDTKSLSVSEPSSTESFKIPLKKPILLDPSFDHLDYSSKPKESHEERVLLKIF